MNNKILLSIIATTLLGACNQASNLAASPHNQSAGKFETAGQALERARKAAGIQAKEKDDKASQPQSAG